MTPHTHCCSATACQKQIPLNMLMCMAHWKLVPAVDQRLVLSTWRARSRAPLDAECVAAHEAAKQQAIAAVEKKQIRKIADKKKAGADFFGINGL